MTLIVATHRNGVPVLLGDVLLSAPRPSHSNVVTFDAVERLNFRHPDHKIAGVHVKLVIVKPTLAVGWTGSLLYARDVISHLVGTLPDEPALTDLETAFHHYHAIEPKADVTLLGALVYGDKFNMFRWDGPTRQFSTGQHFVEGSGAAPFDRQNPEDLRPPERTPIVGTLSSAVGWGMSRIGHLLGGEILAGLNLVDHFGGGFEVVFFDGFDGKTFRRPASLIQIFLRTAILSVGERPEDPSELAIEVGQTSFWQSFENGLKMERIDLDAAPWSTQEMSLPIKSIQTQRASLFSGLDCGEPHPSAPSFVIIHTQILSEDRRLGFGSTVYQLPTDEIQAVHDDTSVHLKFSNQFFLGQCQSACDLMREIRKRGPS